MRPVTAAAALALVLALGSVVALGIGVGDLGSDGPELVELWQSDTGRDVSANHHAVAVGDGRVFAPVSDTGDSNRCGLFALDASTGEERWSYAIPAANCTIHSVADPTVADYDGDGSAEVIVATTEQEVAAFDPETGAKEFRHPLSSYGYTQPVFADLAPQSGAETVVVDVYGSVFVIGSDGDPRWTHRLDGRVWAQPVVDDFDADGEPELLVAGPGANVTLFGPAGNVEWRTTAGPGDGAWLTTGQADEDPALEAVVATVKGGVVAVDGGDGAVQWRRSFGRFAAVGGLSDADGGRAVYAVARDGRLRSLDAATGESRWTTALTVERVQMMPPPRVGDVDGDGSLDLVVAGNDGTVSVVDPSTGTVRATYDRDEKVFTHPTLADVDRDGDDEVLVIYADGRVVALDYR